MKAKNNYGQRDKNVVNIILKTIVFIILTLYAISIIYILVWGVINSLKSNVDFLVKNNIFGLPNPEFSSDELFKLNNYRLILEKF